MKTVNVKGRGKAFGQASSVIIFFALNKIDIVYEDAVSNLNEGIYGIIKKLSYLGIEKNELKTVEFFVDRVEGGFYANHKVSVKVKNEGRNVNNILEILVNCGQNLEMNIFFKSEDEEKLREEALVRAILDGKKKGELIAKALGVKKINILEVTYEGEEISREVNINNKNGYNYNKIFEEIEFVERINITFEV